MRKIFHSMTKVSIVLAMSAPAPIYGQDANADLPLCDSELVLPCLLDDDAGTVMTAEAVAELPVCEASDELPCQLEADGTLMTELRMEQEAEIAAAAAIAAEAEAAAAAEAQAEAEAEARAAAEAAEAAAAEEAARAAEELAAAEAAAAEAAAQAQAEAEAAAAAQAEAEAAAQALAEAEAQAAVEAQQAELDAQIEAELAAQAEADMAAAEEAAAEATAETEEAAPEVAEAEPEPMEEPAIEQAEADEMPEPRPEETDVAELAANAPAVLEIDDPEIAEELAQIEAELAAVATSVPAEVAAEVEAAVAEVAGLPECTDEGPYPCLAEDGSVMSEEMAMALAEAEARAAEEAAQIAAQAQAEPAAVVENTVADADAGLSEEALASEVANEEAKPTQTPVAATAIEEEGLTEEGVVTQTEVVSGEKVRKSSEEFAKVEAPSGEKKKKKGLSNLEKILLLGVGAVVVGKILDNGDKVVDNSGDRVTVQRQDGTYYVLRDDDALLRQDGNVVRTQTFNDGSTLTTVTKPNGEQVKTIRDETGRVLRRTRVLPDGREFLLFDDTVEVERIDVTQLPRESAGTITLTTQENDALGEALRQELNGEFGRRFSLSQIRNIRAVRELVPVIDIEQVTFDTGSSAIKPEEAKKLAKLGVAIQRALKRNPGSVFLIEGHTDATGAATLNLRLSDRRAESLALALTEYFKVPPENLVVQGYGEAYLKVPTLENERLNRRVAVRDITKLIGADEILAMR